MVEEVAEIGVVGKISPLKGEILKSLQKSMLLNRGLEVLQKIFIEECY